MINSQPENLPVVLVVIKNNKTSSDYNATVLHCFKLH